MAEEGASRLREAIVALYSSYGAQQQRANQWLNTFSKQPACWEACVQLLDPAQGDEVCFFCANMLLAKVRADWFKLSQAQQSHMTTLLSTRFQSFLGHGQARLAVQRLGLLLAAVASMSGAHACQSFATTCLGMVGGGAGANVHILECALSMLAALADEVSNMDTSRRCEVVAATAEQFAELTSVMQQLIPSQMAAGEYGVVHSALICLQSWLRLGADSLSTQRLSPGQLYTSQPGLLAALFGLIGARAEEAVTAERIEALTTELLSDLLGQGTYSDNARAERAAADAAISALLALRERALAPGDAGASTGRCVAALASALAERDPELLAGAGGCGPGLVGGGGGAANGGNANGGAHGGGGGGDGGAAGALALAQLMLELMGRPERSVCQAGIDYFLMLNTLPADVRAPQMRSPLYERLAPPLFLHACLPPGFTSWGECIDEDEGAFYRFRSGALTEVLESVYGMVGVPFLVGVLEGVRSAGGSWQHVEGALFCLRAVAAVVRSRLSASFAGPEVALQTQELVLAIITDLCSPSGSAGHHAASNPHVAATAAELIAAYASWFSTCAAAPLEGALQLLVHALHYPDACGPASAAFKVLCVRCAAQLAAGGALRPLSAAAVRAAAAPPPPGGAAPPAGVPYEDRASITEGLARVAAALPTAEAGGAAAELAAPLLERTRSVLEHGAEAAAAAGPSALQRLFEQLSDEVRLLAVVIKQMALTGTGAGPLGRPGAQLRPGATAQTPQEPPPQHPALRVLEACWPVLSAVADSPPCRQQPGVVSAVCAVYVTAVQSARGAAKPLLPLLLRSALDMFAAQQHPACLEVLGTVTETFGELRGEDDGAAAQAAALECAAGAAGEALARATAACQPPSASGDLLRALMAAADAHCVFARPLLLRSAALPLLFEWAIVTAGLREREPAGAALAFLGHLLAALPKLVADGSAEGAEGAAAVRRCVAAQGERLVGVLVVGAVDSAHRQLLRPLAGVLHSLLHGDRATAGAAAGWLLARLQAVVAAPDGGADSAAPTAALLRPSDCEAFARAALRSPPLARGRFDALVMDFAGVARGEGTSDSLLAYEL